MEIDKYNYEENTVWINLDCILVKNECLLFLFYNFLKLLVSKTESFKKKLALAIHPLNLSIYNFVYIYYSISVFNFLEFE